MALGEGSPLIKNAYSVQEDKQTVFHCARGSSDQRLACRGVSSNCVIVRFVEVTTKRDTNFVNVCKHLMNVTPKLNGCGGTSLLMDTGAGCNVLYEKIARKVGATVGGSCRMTVGISSTKIYTFDSAQMFSQIGNVTQVVIFDLRPRHGRAILSKGPLGDFVFPKPGCRQFDSHAE